MSIESEEPTAEPPSVGQRLGVAEAKLALLDRETTQLSWTIVGVAGFAMLMFLAVTLWPVSGPAPTDWDATLEELLAHGVHCLTLHRSAGFELLVGM